MGSFLIIVIAVLVVFMVIAMWPRGRKVSEPVCGGCGYSVQGLASLQCPECGGDLRQVGIYTPAFRPAPGVLAWCLIWTLALPVPAWIISRVVWSALPTNTQTQTKATFTGSSVPQLHSVVITTTIDGIGTRPGQIVMADEPVEVTIIPQSGGLRSLGIDLRSPAFNGVNLDDAPRRTAIVLQSVESWFGKSGMSLEDDAVKQAAADIASNVVSLSGPNRMARGGGSFPSVTTSARTLTSSNNWFEAVAISLWATTWIGGLFLIVLRRRRKRGQQDDRSATIVATG